MKKVILIISIIVILADICVCVIYYNKIEDDAKEHFATLVNQQRLVAQKQVDSLFIHIKMYSPFI